MARVVGLLPASGNATRIGNIPKFCFPIDDSVNLVQWHVNLMLDVCDRVHISTKREWMPILNNIKFPKNVFIYEIEPSTQPDAMAKMIIDKSDKHLMGMPDTFIKNLKSNFYRDMSEIDSEIVLSAFKYTNNHLGSVGQIDIDKDNNVIDLVDKDPTCLYNYIYGAVSFNNIEINSKDLHLGNKINSCIKNGLSVKAVLIDGDYIDAGTIRGLRLLYKGE